MILTDFLSPHSGLTQYWEVFRWLTPPAKFCRPSGTILIRTTEEFDEF